MEGCKLGFVPEWIYRGSHYDSIGWFVDRDILIGAVWVWCSVGFGFCSLYGARVEVSQACEDEDGVGVTGRAHRHK